MNLEIRPDMTVTEMQRVCHGRSTLAGWWDDIYQVVATLRSSLGDEVAEKTKKLLLAAKICLIHSETSEMMEGLRKDLMDDHLPHRTMEEVEAADIAIRLFDYCEERKIDLAGAICEKLDYNAQRTDHTLEAREGEGGKNF